MLAEDFIEYLDGVRPTASGWEARCPSHDDRAPSLVISEGDEGGVVVHCHAGCSAEEICRSVGLELRHLMEGVEVEPSLDDLARHKQLPPAFLRSVGVHDLHDNQGVGIDYLDRQGVVIATKTRTSLVAGHGTRWPRGQALLAYGLWKLTEFAAARWVILVEGESDCWTAWAHGYPCLGVPGASCVAATISQDVLAPFERIYVVQETDEGGRRFVENVSRVIRTCGWAGSSYVVNLPAKDVSELYVGGPGAFVSSFNSALAAARPLSAATATPGQPARLNWPVPAALVPATSSPPRLSPSLLPDSLRDWIVDTATRIGVPLDYVAVPAVVALGTVVGRKVVARPKKADSFAVVPNLWGALVGESGAAKSPALVAALEPLARLDDALRATQLQQAADRDFSQMVVKERREVLAKAIRDALKAGRDPRTLRQQMALIEAPVSSGPQLMVSDATAEKLAAILMANVTDQRRRDEGRAEA